MATHTHIPIYKVAYDLLDVELNHRRRASPQPAQGELFEQTG